MSVDWVVHMTRRALWVTALLGGPFLAVGLVIGLVVSILQAATQINEMALTFIPKVGSVVATLWIMADWILRQWLTFATELISSIADVGVVP